MTETDPTVRRLRSQLVGAAQSVSVPRDMRARVESARRRRRRRNVAAACGVTTAALVAAATFALSGSSPSRHVVITSPAHGVGAPSASFPAEAPVPLTHIGSTWWLPGADVAIRRLITSVGVTAPDFEQLYWGSSASGVSELLLQSIDTSLGLPDPTGTLAGPVPGQSTLRIGPYVAQLFSGGGTTNLWYHEPDGIQVEASATGLSGSQLVKIMSSATAAPGARLGLVLAGSLPTNLHLAHSALSNHTSPWSEEIDLGPSGCNGSIYIWDGIGPLLIPKGGDIQRTTVGDGPAELDSLPGAGSTLTWQLAPGITAQLDVDTRIVPSCPLSSIAAGVHTATTAQWRATTSMLGSHFTQLTRPSSTPDTTIATHANTTAG